MLERRLKRRYLLDHILPCSSCGAWQTSSGAYRHSAYTRCTCCNKKVVVDFLVEPKALEYDLFFHWNMKNTQVYAYISRYVP